MMEVSSTEVQNNFGKYVALAAHEDVIITRNGRKVAKLTAFGKGEDLIAERRASYEFGNHGGRKASFEEFLALTKDNDEEQYEYIDGEIYAMTSPKTEHQTALMELAGNFYVWSQGKPCRPFVAPYDIQLRRIGKQDQLNVVQPDLMLICDLEEHLAEDGYYKGVPALLVEILSESTRRKDLFRKAELYMQSGVQEYWVVNPFSKEITIYRYADWEVAENCTFRLGETAKSFLFEGLTAELDRVFSFSK